MIQLMDDGIGNLNTPTCCSAGKVKVVYNTIMEHNDNNKDMDNEHIDDSNGSHTS